jgi:hypothetical protein
MSDFLLWPTWTLINTRLIKRIFRCIVFPPFWCSVHVLFKSLLSCSSGCLFKIEVRWMLVRSFVRIMFLKFWLTASRKLLLAILLPENAAGTASFRHCGFPLQPNHVKELATCNIPCYVKCWIHFPIHSSFPYRSQVVAEEHSVGRGLRCSQAGDNVPPPVLCPSGFELFQRRSDG